MATAEDAVHASVSVEAPPELCFHLFTQDWKTWWPLDTHHIGKVPAVDAVLEPHAGGRWYERGVDGSTCTWGVVRAYEPPARLLLGWQLDADWKHDPACESEVEVRFVAEGPRRTRVELTHRRLEAFGARRGEVRGALGSPGGWPGLLERLRARAER